MRLAVGIVIGAAAMFALMARALERGTYIRPS